MAFDAVNAALILSKGVGIPPNDMQSFNAQSQEDGIKITMIGPKNSYVYGAENSDTLVCTPAGVMVRYSDTDYPADINDGTLLGVYNENYNPVNPTEVTDNLIGLVFEQTYYFSAFPFSVDGIYNKSQAPANRASCQWVGNKGTINVMVATYEGYTGGEIGEYTITLVDQASSGPQNIQRTASGTGLTQIGNLDEGKTYIVTLTDVGGLTCDPSEPITIVAGETYNVTMTYREKYGSVVVNVTTNPTGMPIGSYTITLTPTAGGSSLQQSGSGSQSLIFNSVLIGTYNITGSSINHYTFSGGQVSVTGGQQSLHNAKYSFSATLEESSWAEIDQIGQLGLADDYWSIGDTKNITVSGESLTLEIVGFNHDDLTNGGKAGITFGLKNCMEEPRAIDPDWEVDTFYGSPMETWLNGDLFNALPADLQAVIKPANKKTSDGIWYSREENLQKRTIITNSMKVFLFSVVEIHGVELGTIPGEGVQYARFTNTESRNKWYPNDGTGTGRTYIWWTRSPSNNSRGCFMWVRDGKTDATESPMPTYKNGVCFGFCV